MKRSILLLTVFLAFSFISVTAQQPEVLDNKAVVKLVKAGFKEKTVIAIIHSRTSRFDLSPDGLVQLKRSGVSESIILAMVSKDGSYISTDDDSEEQSFFRGMDPGNQTKKRSDGGSMDLFGNSSGSSSQTKNRGPDGSSENDTSSTGSATVKILRPPSEEGDSPKLQKTPALNNDSIVDLVEAGFSDGTIIRRIEQSPANFNLSPASIENLHKRHVTDKVIAAMTSAMGDDPSGGKQTRN